MLPTESVIVHLTRRLTILGAGGVGVGAALAASGRTPGVRAFGQQTAAWGAIDLVIAGVGVARRSAPPTAQRLRTVLLINAALDVGYIAAGAHLATRRPDLNGRLEPDQARGHGLAVVVQGALLLALDLHHARALTGIGDQGSSQLTDAAGRPAPPGCKDSSERDQRQDPPPPG